VLDGGPAINGEGPRCAAVPGRGRAEEVEWGQRECGGAIMSEWWRRTGSEAAGHGGTAGGQWRKKWGRPEEEEAPDRWAPPVGERRGEGGPKVVQAAGSGWAEREVKRPVGWRGKRKGRREGKGCAAG
jgi:hypothetical protein